MIDLLEFFIPIFALGHFIVKFLIFKFELSIYPYLGVVISIIYVLLPN